jgi:hypothetical protein
MIFIKKFIYYIRLTENTCEVSVVVEVVGLLILLSRVRFPSVADLNQMYVDYLPDTTGALSAEPYKFIFLNLFLIFHTEFHENFTHYTRVFSPEIRDFYSAGKIEKACFT